MILNANSLQLLSCVIIYAFLMMNNHVKMIKHVSGMERVVKISVNIMIKEIAKKMLIASGIT